LVEFADPDASAIDPDFDHACGGMVRWTRSVSRRQRGRARGWPTNRLDSNLTLLFSTGCIVQHLLRVIPRKRAGRSSVAASSRNRLAVAHAWEVHVKHAALVVTAFLAGCSSIQSVPEPTGELVGLYYYMPKRDFVVTITRDKKTDQIAITESPAYPDLGQQYLLQYSRNAIGKNIMKIGVHENGLLSTLNAESQSGVTEALKGLATTLGTISVLRKKAVTACDDGANVFLVPAEPREEFPLCDAYSITVERMTFKDESPASTRVSTNDTSGIYYRIARPYRVKVSGLKSAEAVLFSPNDSPTRFLPVPRTFFANGKVDMVFTDGMPTKYDVDTDGELVAAFKLPAEVIRAYFSAVGAMFDSVKERDTKQAEQLQATLKLELAKQKYAACLAAIAAHDAATIASLGC